MKRFLILGYFGFYNDQLDGQTVKTRNVYQLFHLKMSDKVHIDYFDTQNLHFYFFSFFKMIRMILRSDKIIYLPAHNNLKFIFPFLFILCWFKRCEILYFVVGGWLTDFLKSKKIHVAFLSNITAILTESKELSKKLMLCYNFHNVKTFPNFRIHSFTPNFVENKKYFKIVFFARINKMKGIDYVFELGKYFLNFFFPNKPVIIDFYGPVDKQDEKYFYENISKYSNTHYKGILQPEKIYDTLTDYDLMVFPTRYYTEGFPGTILDAYIAGLPIVATNWKYANEFIVQEQTGIIVPFENSKEDFIKAVVKIYNDKDLLNRMKNNAYEESKNYSSEGAWNILANNNFIKI